MTATKTRNGIYTVICQWKGDESSFTVVAHDYASACDQARRQCKKRVGMPMSSVAFVRFDRDE